MKKRKMAMTEIIKHRYKRERNSNGIVPIMITIDSE